MEKKKSMTMLYKIVLVILCGFLYGTVFWTSFKYMNKKLFEERASNVQVVMSKITQNAKTGMNQQWITLKWIANQLSLAECRTMEELETAMELYRSTYPNTIRAIYMIDSEGYCHVPGEKTYRWGNPALLETGEDECYISSTELRISQDNTPHIFFISSLENTYEVEGVEITHIGTAIEMNFMDDFFHVDEYGEESLAFIIRRTGGQIYHQEKENQISGVLNVISALEQGKYSYGAAHAGMVADIEKGQANCLRVEYKGEIYYAAYAPMEVNDWMAMLLIPGKLVGTANQAFISSLTLTILVIVLGSVSIVLLFIWRGNRKERKRREEVNRQLKLAAEAERRSNEAKSRFLSSMSHDIRTPMNAIIGMNELAASHIDDKEYVLSCFGKAKLAGDHLLTLINDVLDISKVEAGMMRLNVLPFSLANMVENLVGISYPQVREKGHHFDMRVHDMRYEWVRSDQLRINQVFINILSNAIKYTPNGRRITVDLIQEIIPDADDKIRLIYIVEDSGIGMSEEYQKNMYTAFAREEGRQISGIQGTGLGLAICKQMIDLLGGTIECESSQGAGTKFTVTLELEKEKESLEVVPLPMQETLLVDDDELFLETAGNMLETLGLQVTRASGCEEAVALLEKNTYQIIIYDWEMACKHAAKASHIREKAGNALLLAGAYATELIEDSAKAAGVDAVVSKPFLFTPVRRCLAALLGIEQNHEDRKIENRIDITGMHLLVAEDNDMNWEIVNAVFEMHGATAERAENGQICVDKLVETTAGTYSLVLMDIQMPVMNGYTAARAIRSSNLPHLKDIPIIAMTADAFADDVQKCMESGMNGHIAKPVDIDILFSVLKECTQNGE